MTKDGGKEAWMDGYNNIRQPMSPFSCFEYTSWYWESFWDGQFHGIDDRAAENCRKQLVENTKAIRAKFKAIRATNPT